MRSGGVEGYAVWCARPYNMACASGDPVTGHVYRENGIHLISSEGREIS